MSALVSLVLMVALVGALCVCRMGLLAKFPHARSDSERARSLKTKKSVHEVVFVRGVPQRKCKSVS